MSTVNILTILAVLLGPTVGVLIARWRDNSREERTRKMDVFRALMRTRRTPLHVDHVGALNLVEIEFADSPAVTKAFKALHDHYGSEPPRQTTEIELEADPPEVKQRKLLEYNQRVYSDRQGLLTKLLSEMAKSLRFKIEQLEILRGGYHPLGHQILDDEQTAIRRLFANIALGNAVLPVGVVYVDKLGRPSNNPQTPLEQLLNR